MDKESQLKREFDAEKNTFLLKLRCELTWDEEAFRILTSLMYDVAKSLQGKEEIPTWIAQGYWFCDTWIRDWTSHENFPRPGKDYYQRAIELIHDLSYFLFMSESPYEDNSLEQFARGIT